MKDSILQYMNDMALLAGLIKQQLSLNSVMASKMVLLQAQGMDSSGAWLLSNGLAKQYRYTDDGKMEVRGFWKKGDIIMLPQSFLRGQKASDYIELIEDSMIAPFQAKDIQHLEATFPEAKIVSAISDVYIQRAELRLQLVSMNTSQALQHLATLYPLNRIRNKDIASFLLKDPSSFYRAKR